MLVLFSFLCLIAIGPLAHAAEEDAPALDAKLLSGMELRTIGPALTSGRIGDFAVHPQRRDTYYVAVASGGVWKTENNGTTWTPIFDDQGSYSIGCVTIDPNDPLTVWVGTGENNSQRSVGYGDGVYKSTDGGATWKKMGLADSEHIAKIVVDPRDSRRVLVAAQGPLWNAGGDRGLYLTTDGGETWEGILEVDEHTGVTDLVLDPRDPDVMYAATYQRRRHVWTLINGGPGSGIHKSVDGGKTWTELTKGLPDGDLGRIGLAISPAAPDTVYAIVEAERDKSGFFRSTNGGGTWERRSDYIATSPQYYQEIVPDPKDPERVYSLDTWMHVTEDGGKTWSRMPSKTKHVDDHAMWIDPENTDYLLVGCDGGVYESYDRGHSWHFKANLPVTQFYRVTADTDRPFYNVYGGTQDNATLGGPAQTKSVNGINNRDWFVTVFGDGFKTQVDPTNPDIIYSQWQYGGLVRFDRKSGQRVDIQPQPEPGEEPLRWNWNSPLIISPHDPSRLYFAAQRIFRSDDRGSSWTPISGDLTRDLDRNELPVMDRVWSADAVSKNASTSPYGNIVSLDESPLVENLIYAGTDDGLIQVSEDGGESWSEIEGISGVPEMSYVSALIASHHSADRVYAAFDNHKRGDFEPYVLVSEDRGKTWSSVSGDLPERGTVYALAEDPEDPTLLFAGTEFGLFVTVDRGEHWTQLKGGLPVITVRDLDIQEREVDLVVATFGRGIYILDDYTPLRGLQPAATAQEALLFPVSETLMYMQTAPLGLREKAFQGDSFYTAPNPPPSALITYYLKDTLETRADARRKRELELREQGDPIEYPTWEQLRAEEREAEPAVVLTVKDASGNVVRRLEGPVSAGFHRVRWNLRHPAPDPVSLEGHEGSFWGSGPEGPMVVPGSYEVTLAKKVDGKLTELAGPRKFQTVPIGAATLETQDREALLAFQKKTASLQRAVLGSVRAVREADSRIEHLRKAILDTPKAGPALLEELGEMEHRLLDLRDRLTGDRTKRQRHAPVLPGIVQRVNRIVEGHWRATSAPTQTHVRSYEIAADQFGEWLPEFRKLVEEDLASLEQTLEDLGAPWTPGRIPSWP
jgi:photosystem II stability/assembly factor-like uncharacterized protein